MNLKEKTEQFLSDALRSDDHRTTRVLFDDARNLLREWVNESNRAGNN